MFRSFFQPAARAGLGALRHAAITLSTALWLLPVMAAAPAADHAVGPAPAWVTPLTPETSPARADVSASEGVRYLLLDTQVRVDGAERISFHHVASQAANERGVESRANIEIRFDPSYQKLTLHAINIRRASQVIAKLPSAKVKLLQREAALESLIYDGSQTAHVFLDDVRVGDVVEYAYSLRGNNPVFGNRFFGGFDFQFNAPIARVHSRLLWPADRPVHWHYLNQASPPQVALLGHQKVFSWDLRDIAGKTIESEAPGWFDPYPAAQWSEFADWKEVNAWALPLYQPPATPGPRLQAAAAQLMAKNAEPAARLAAALRFVQSDIRYLGIEVGPGSHAPNPPETVLERLYGDCKDKALLTISLLRGMGIEAVPALVHTTQRRSIAGQQPSPGAFNHVLVRAKLGDQLYWLDPTRSPQRGDLAHIAQADYGMALVVHRDTNGLSPMAGEAANLYQREVYSTVDASAGPGKPAQLTVKTVTRGVAADNTRRTLDNATRESVQKQYLNFYTRFFGEMEVTAPFLVVDEHQANEVSVTEHYLLKAFWQRSDANQRMEADVAPPDLSEFFSRPQNVVRTAPLALQHPVQFKSVVQVTLPEGWTIDPSTDRVDDPAFEYRRKVEWHPLTRTLSLTDHYTSLVDHIQADQVSRYADDLEKARHASSFVLYSRDDDATPASVAPAAASIPVAAESASDSLHWLPAVTGVLALIGFGWLARRIYDWDPASPVESADPVPRWVPRGIGGWLLLLAIGLPLSVLRLLRDIADLAPGFKAGTWLTLNSPAYDAYHPALGPLVIVELVGNVGLLVIGALLTVLFFQRRNSLPTLYIRYLVIAVLFRWADQLAALAIPVSAEDIKAVDWARLIATTVVSAIWVAYFRQSARVQATFVRRRWRVAAEVAHDAPAQPAPAPAAHPPAPTAPPSLAPEESSADPVV